MSRDYIQKTELQELIRAERKAAVDYSNVQYHSDEAEEKAGVLKEAKNKAIQTLNDARKALDAYADRPNA